MPVVAQSNYQPPLLCSNPHVQTVVPTIFRSVPGVTYQRERIEIPDGDFLDLDWSRVGSKRLAIVLHGLEGDSGRPYMMGMVRALNRNDWDALAMIGEPALPALAEMLNDGPEGARVRAAGALRRIGVGALADRQTSEFGPQFWPAIGALFTTLNDSNRLVRHTAYEALARLGLLETLIIPA